MLEDLSGAQMKVKMVADPTDYYALKSCDILSPAKYSTNLAGNANRVWPKPRSTCRVVLRPSGEAVKVLIREASLRPYC